MIGKKTNKQTNFHIALLTILFKLSKIKVFLFKKHPTHTQKKQPHTRDIPKKKKPSKVK